MASSPIQLRWRVVDGRIPLKERHLRSLDPLQLPPPLTAWIRSRLEWAVDNLLAKDTDAVLCLAIDPEKDVVVSLEELRALPKLTQRNLYEQDGFVTGVRIEGKPLEGIVFCESDGALFISAEALASAASTLAYDLASTLGFAPVVAPLSAECIKNTNTAFLVSDEFGFIPIDLGHHRPAEMPLSNKLKECLDKVFRAVHS